MLCKKVKMMEMNMKEMIKRVQQDQPAILYHSDIRRCYTKGVRSIYRQMSVPLGISGGKALSHFAIVHVENAVNHLLGLDFPLKTLKINKLVIGRTQANAFTHCFIKNFTRSCKSWSTVLKVCTSTYSIFGQIGFRRTDMRRQKNIVATFYFLCAA
jgi:hypothetical protein